VVTAADHYALVNKAAAPGAFHLHIICCTGKATSRQARDGGIAD
jgi:hypothetical protein